MKSMRRVSVLFAVGILAAAARWPCGAAEVPLDPLVVATGEPECPCPCSPVAGAWIASFSSPVETVVHTFKFAPVDEKCEQFVVTAQASTRLAKVIKAFPEADDLTEFVGTACQTEPKKVEFTALAYGVKKDKTTEKVVFIAVMSGCVDLPDGDGKCSCNCGKNCDGKGHCECDEKCTGDINCRCKCGKSCDGKGICNCSKDCKHDARNDEYKDGDHKDGECPDELCANVCVAYYLAEQDDDRDGFPDTCNEVICACYSTKLKRVQLQPPCEPGDSFLACLEACKDCSTEATGRAFFKLNDDDKEMFFVLKVEDLKDPKLANIHVSQTPGEIGAPAVALYPIEPDNVSGLFSGILSTGTFTADDFIGPLAGKTMADLIKAINEKRAFVVVTAKKFPNGELCGKIEDP